MTLQNDERFWEYVATRLEERTGLDHPSKWKKAVIEDFIYNFLKDIEIFCRTDKRKAALCGIPYINGEFLFDQLSFSYDSFRRIFITRESNGNRTTKNMFAIYLGHESYVGLLSQIDKDDSSADKSSVEGGNASLFNFFDGTRITQNLLEHIEQVLLSMIGKFPKPSRSLWEELGRPKNDGSEILELMLGLHCFFLEQWKSASIHLEKARPIFKKHYQLYFLTGIVFTNFRFGEESFNKAIEYYDLAISRLPSKADDDLIARLFTYKGSVLKRKTDYENALVFLLKGLYFANHPRELARAHYNLAGVYALTNDKIGFKKSMEYLRNKNERYYLIALKYIKRWAPDFYSDEDIL